MFVFCFMLFSGSLVVPFLFLCFFVNEQVQDPFTRPTKNHEICTITSKIQIFILPPPQDWVLYTYLGSCTCSADIPFLFSFLSLFNLCAHFFGFYLLFMLWPFHPSNHSHQDTPDCWFSQLFFRRRFLHKSERTVGQLSLSDPTNMLTRMNVSSV